MTMQEQIDALRAILADMEARTTALPAPFRPEEFGISATAPGFDPTGEGSAYQHAAEPAPGSDAEHPPLGYRLEPVGGRRRKGYVFWHSREKYWDEGWVTDVGRIVEGPTVVANPIPAAEGDSRVCAEWQEAGLTPSMMWDVIQEMRKTLGCDGTTTPVERAERVMRSIEDLRAIAQRETERAEAATVRAVIAERELAELRAPLRTMGEVEE